MTTSNGLLPAIIRIAALAGVCAALGACQSTQSRQQELARICADPATMRPDSFYFAECVAYRNPTPAQRSQIYYRTAPEG
ncbi:hypothetical protein ACFFJB_01910 [Camelimonas abortus]|uniref:Entry exclusion lipoprotein TrbK n=1 Tax=Camelimonas abortus TaxID=1017184 RepID=A0ABV7LBP6_9HYPH